MIYSLDNLTPQIHPTAFVHPSAEVTGDVRLGARVSVWPQAVLRGDIERIEIGEDANLQDASVFHTSHGLPVVLGREVTVGHGAIVHGCRVGDSALIGMGAILLDGCVVGAESLIGAGALLREGFEVPPGHLVLGVPARVVRPLKPEEIRDLHKGAADYVRYAARYRNAKKIG